MYRQESLESDIIKYGLKSTIFNEYFKKLDTKRTGILRYNEIEKMIKEIVSKELSEEEIKYVTSLIIEDGITFIAHLGNKNSDIYEINKQEYNEILTSENRKIESLKNREMELDLKRQNRTVIDRKIERNGINEVEYRTTSGLCEGIEIIEDPERKIKYLKNHNTK